MRRYLFVYILALCLSAVHAVRCIASHRISSQSLNMKFTSMFHCSKRYFVGISYGPLQNKPKMALLWLETASKTEKTANDLAEFIGIHVSKKLKEKMIIRQAYQVNEKNPDGVRVITMKNTPGTSLTDFSVLATVSEMISAGRIIRESLGKTRTWDNY